MVGVCGVARRLRACESRRACPRRIERDDITSATRASECARVRMRDREVSTHSVRGHVFASRQLPCACASRVARARVA